MNDDIMPFREDARLRARALKNGLFIGVDKNERCYLGLPPGEVARRRKRNDPQGKMNKDPWLVLCAVTTDDVRNYLELHTGKHRFLTPGQVYGAFLSQALRGCGVMNGALARGAEPGLVPSGMKNPGPRGPGL